MGLFLQIGAAVLGAVFGSFLNALIYRFGTEKSVFVGRSACMKCGHTLSPADLIPVFSYLFLKGKCRYCRAPFSLQYPLVELAGLLLSLGLFLHFGFSLSYAAALIIGCTLLFLFVFDLRYQLLPMKALMLLALVCLGLLFISCNGVCHVIAPSIWTVASGPLLGGPLLFISLISKGRAMGWGDGLLELSLGWLLGLSQGFFALLVAFWSGAIVGIALIYLSKRYTMKSEVPFAPFLIFGATVAFFFHVDLFSLL